MMFGLVPLKTTGTKFAFNFSAVLAPHHEIYKMFVKADESLKDIFSCSAAHKCTFWQTTATNFQVFTFGADHGGVSQRY